MTRYLLDTNVVIDSLNGNPSIRRSLEATPLASRLLSSVTCFELWYGVFRSARPESNAQRLREALKDFAVLDLDHEDGRTAGEIRVQLQRRKQTIRPYDVLIAGQALARGMTLVTTNEGEFRRVTGLRVENWAAPQSH